MPAAPEQEHRFWYQYYFHTERGRIGLQKNRREFCRLIWRLWSPNWVFDDATFERTATSFDNPDFVDVTIQSYRHRFKNAAGDPDLEPIEQRLAAQPTIPVPSIALHGEAGMSTAEYAIGTIAAAAFAAVLYTVVTGDAVVSALDGLVQRALSVQF